MKYGDLVNTPNGQGRLVGLNLEKTQVLVAYRSADWIGELPNRSKAIHKFVDLTQVTEVFSETGPKHDKKLRKALRSAGKE